MSDIVSTGPITQTAQPLDGTGEPMRAAVMRNSAWWWIPWPTRCPGGEVLVKTLACGICGSDLHALKHAKQFVENAPGGMGMDVGRDVVMGHEFCAEVLAHGPGTSGQLKVGTRVCSFPMVIRGGVPVAVGYSNDLPGGYAERMVLMEQLLLPVGNGLSTDRAALTEPMAVGQHAVEMARLGADDIPLVIGCGPIGLAVIASLRARGVRPIVAADYRRCAANSPKRSAPTSSSTRRSTRPTRAFASWRHSPAAVNGCR
jgi:threonine dehydrogenase-like Zn-dependent dehydrogenase